MMDKISCDIRYGSDNNRYLIALLKHLQDPTSEPLPERLTKKDYDYYRTMWKEKESNPFLSCPDYLIGCAGFLGSFNGRFFDGGYAKPGFDKGRYRDYYREARDNIMAQFATGRLNDVKFACHDYHGYTTAEDTVIYCDPPYQNRKRYQNAKNFDYGEFWDFVRHISKKNHVFISEMQAPDDFVPIWEGEVNRSIKPNDKFTASEKLFIYKKGLH